MKQALQVVVTPGRSRMNGTVKAVLAVILGILLFRIFVGIAYAILNLVVPLAFMALVAWLLYRLINRTFSSPHGRPFR